MICKTRNRIRNRRGFTLVEAIIASGIFLVATSMVISATYALQYAARQEKIQNEVERDATRSLDFLQRDVNRASEILAAWEGFATTDTVLVLEIPNFDSKEVPISGAEGHVIFTLIEEEGILERIEFGPESEGSELLSYRITRHIAGFELFFDHLSYDSLVLSEKPLGDVFNVEVALVTEQEKDGVLYTRNFRSSATIRSQS